MPMDRRTFSTAMLAGATSILMSAHALAAPTTKARNVVLAHGLFADGSCWLDVIARLQAASMN